MATLETKQARCSSLHPGVQVIGLNPGLIQYYTSAKTCLEQVMQSTEALEFFPSDEGSVPGHSG